MLVRGPKSPNIEASAVQPPPEPLSGGEQCRLLCLRVMLLPPFEINALLCVAEPFGASCPCSHESTTRQFDSQCTECWPPTISTRVAVIFEPQSTPPTQPSPCRSESRTLTDPLELVLSITGTLLFMIVTATSYTARIPHPLRSFAVMVMAGPELPELIVQGPVYVPSTTPLGTPVFPA